VEHTTIFVSMTLQSLPPGLSLLRDFITPDEERMLLTYLARQEWRTDLRRRTIHYGGTYCKLPPRVAKGNIEAFFKKQETRTMTDPMSYECPKAATTIFQQEHNTQNNTSEMTRDSAIMLNANGKRERAETLSTDTVQRGQSTKRMKSTSTIPSPKIIRADHTSRARLLTAAVPASQPIPRKRAAPVLHRERIRRQPRHLRSRREFPICGARRRPLAGGELLHQVPGTCKRGRRQCSESQKRACRENWQGRRGVAAAEKLDGNAGRVEAEMAA